MFETLDTMISLAIVYLILSMVNKYALSIFKRSTDMKGKVVTTELSVLAENNGIKYLRRNLKEDDPVRVLIENPKDTREALAKMKTSRITKAFELVEESLYLDHKEKLDAEKEKVGGVKEKLDAVKKELEKDFVKVSLEAKQYRAQAEVAFDTAMERISKNFEKNIRMWALYCGLIIALLLNADFFAIYNNLSKVKVNNELQAVRIIDRSEEIKAKIELIDKKIDQINANPESPDFEELKKSIGEAGTDISGLTNEFERAGLNLGWSSAEFHSIKYDPLLILKKIIGLLVSGLLISFGAPFWHDFLNSVAGIRNVLKKKGEASSSSQS